MKMLSKSIDAKNAEMALSLLKNYSPYRLKDMLSHALNAANLIKHYEEIYKLIECINDAVNLFLDSNKNHEAEFARFLGSSPPDLRTFLILKLEDERKNLVDNLQNPIDEEKKKERERENQQLEKLNRLLIRPALQRPQHHKINNLYNPKNNEFHFFKVDAAQFESLSPRYKGLKGNDLKKAILKNEMLLIELTQTIEDLDRLQTERMQSTEYQVLHKAQGLFSIITGRKTSSEKALEAMFAEQRENIRKSTSLVP